MNTHRQQLAQLRADYTAALPGKLAATHASWRAHLQGDAQATETLLRQLHTLAGSAGSFGHAELGTAARLAHAMLRELLTAADGGPPALRQRLQEQLDALVHLPIALAAPALEPLVEPASEAPNAPLLYLCEDDDLLAAQLSTQLTYFGYRVICFNQPDDLASGLRHLTPAAILMDVSFAQGSLAGPQGIDQLRQQLGAALPPVCFLSARADFSARLAAVRAGAQAYFVKPIDINALTERLDVLTARVLTEPYRVLIVDDSDTKALYHALVLNGHDILTEVAHAPAHAAQSLVDFRPDLILMDLHMPDCSGGELAQVIRQQDAYLDIPILFLSGELDAELQQQSRLAGGDEFLVTPIPEDQLVRFVIARAERYRSLHRLILRDSLTGLLNHAAIHDALISQLAQQERNGKPLAVALIDLDHFKEVNDSHGHPAGDQVLKALSRLLRQRLRRGDLVGRYGGEEFIVLFPDTTAAGAKHALDPIRELFGQLPHRGSQDDFYVQFSAGIAEFPRYTAVEALIHAADEALYRAKREGRNRVLTDPATSEGAP